MSCNSEAEQFSAGLAFIKTNPYFPSKEELEDLKEELELLLVELCEATELAFAAWKALSEEEAAVGEISPELEAAEEAAEEALAEEEAARREWEKVHRLWVLAHASDVTAN